jgi:hypothetical protein
VIPAFDRRRLLAGGGALAGATLLAGCGASARRGGEADAAPGPGTQPGAGDIPVLRTASSLEALVVDTYRRLLAGGLVTATEQVALLHDLSAHHRTHADTVDQATAAAGGRPVDRPNPVIAAQVVRPALARVKTQADGLALAYALESLLAQTYQRAVGTLRTSAHNVTAASIGGVEARHVTLLGIILADGPYPTVAPTGFQSDDAAVRAGTGV